MIPESLQASSSKSGINTMLMKLKDGQYEFCCFNKDQPIPGTYIRLGPGMSASFCRTSEIETQIAKLPDGKSLKFQKCRYSVLMMKSEFSYTVATIELKK